ncbi:response regulator transcription factor [Owenweeksia hongkongensis]|uniref:Response regulator containing a CheY-like receiver domain and an HTH DNA-binding domain n=1 Tax=Owenweeksia hongkongensis (strain DSM 17368 / CIP 108786 / JCM 12287 / NRRL B-23963 / UST20020801) TaxID=926562 RepID=G8R4G1_OWEHD|nr:response regulator transcription factor [Owenweeksia hongkongensis]AEV32050.1 response regulator containing a CheY-like receiver domain and an HTH DNA-binding domain [Owenweeksia hongkongensis DSM 17368]
MIRVLLADDHKMFLEGLYSILSHEEGFKILGQASDGVELMELLKTNQPDVIVLDINMPNMDGIESASKIVEEYPEVKILIVSMFKKSMIIEKLMKIGVHGYILKDAGKKELLAAVRSVAMGTDYFGEEVKQKIVEKMQRKNNGELELTEREIEILEQIAKGFTTNQISENLFISPHTVETHRKNLMNKAHTNNVVQLINWGRENEWLRE